MTAPERVRDRQAMIAGMEPMLDPGEYVFCSLADGDGARALAAGALAWFAEAEGVSLILPAAQAAKLALPVEQRMRRITLGVHSALDGIGLTAAVSGALADAGIACNIVAAYHHDHVFVPSDAAASALRVLLGLQTSARNARPPD